MGWGRDGKGREGRGRKGEEGKGGEYCHFFLYTLSTVYVYGPQLSEINR